MHSRHSTYLFVSDSDEIGDVDVCVASNCVSTSDVASTYKINTIDLFEFNNSITSTQKSITLVHVDYPQKRDEHAGGHNKQPH